MFIIIENGEQKIVTYTDKRTLCSVDKKARDIKQYKKKK